MPLLGIQILFLCVQDTTSRTLYAMYAPTTVMTGNVTQVVIDLVDLASGRGTPEAKARVRKMLPAILAFTAGALRNAVTYTLIGFWCRVAPLAARSLLFIRELRRKTPVALPRS